jgi:uncharacterized protein (UPF0212 family)
MSASAYCPHCGELLDSQELGYCISIAMRVDSGEDTCPHCGRKFFWERHTHTYFTSQTEIEDS